MSFRVPASVLNYRIIATIDNGARRIVISYKIVEKYNIPYQAKK